MIHNLLYWHCHTVGDLIMINNLLYWHCHTVGDLTMMHNVLYWHCHNVGDLTMTHNAIFLFLNTLLMPILGAICIFSRGYSNSGIGLGVLFLRTFGIGEIVS